MLWLAVSTAAGWSCRDFYLKPGDGIWAYNCSFEMCLCCLAADFRASGSTSDREDRMTICRNQKQFGKSLLAEYQENKKSIWDVVNILQGFLIQCGELLLFRLKIPFVRVKLIFVFWHKRKAILILGKCTLSNIFIKYEWNESHRHVRERPALEREILLYFVDEMFSDDFPQACVELLSMFMEDHGVGVPVQLLKAQPTVVFPLYLLDGVLKKVPDVVHILLIHRHLVKIKNMNTFLPHCISKGGHEFK